MVGEGTNSFCWFSIFLQLFLNPLSKRDTINQRQNAWLGRISSSIGRIIARLPKKGYDFQQKKQRNKIQPYQGFLLATQEVVHFESGYRGRARL